MLITRLATLLFLAAACAGCLNANHRKHEGGVTSEYDEFRKVHDVRAPRLGGRWTNFSIGVTVNNVSGAISDGTMFITFDNYLGSCYFTKVIDQNGQGLYLELTDVTYDVGQYSVSTREKYRVEFPPGYLESINNNEPGIRMRFYGKKEKIVAIRTTYVRPLLDAASELASEYDWLPATPENLKDAI